MSWFEKAKEIYQNNPDLTYDEVAAQFGKAGKTLKIEYIKSENFLVPLRILSHLMSASLSLRKLMVFIIFIIRTALIAVRLAKKTYVGSKSYIVNSI